MSDDERSPEEIIRDSICTALDEARIEEYEAESARRWLEEQRNSQSLRESLAAEYEVVTSEQSHELAAARELARVREEALKEVEWLPGPDYTHSKTLECPCCLHADYQGHSGDCLIGEALYGHTAAPAAEDARREAERRLTEVRARAFGYLQDLWHHFYQVGGDAEEWIRANQGEVNALFSEEDKVFCVFDALDAGEA